MRYLAIDYGGKNIGLAVCDADETICSPYAVIEAGKGPFEKIAEIIKSENIDVVVVGLPVNMDGSYGPQAQVSLKFATKLKQFIDVPVQFQDERLSSFAAEEKFADVELPKKQRIKKLDAVAAAHILEAFLESKNT